MLYNPNKKGTIILSHYRSGGTRLLGTTWLSIGEKNTTNLKEWNHSLSNNEKEVDTGTHNPSKHLYSLLKSTDKYCLLLINYPVDISNFYQNKVFDKLKDDYEIVVLERKDKVNCFLSLPLWEQFIKAGLYDDNNDWTEENMEHFHKDRLISKIHTHQLSLGYTTQTPHINGLLKDFISDIHMLQKIQKEYNFTKIYYEDFKDNIEYLFSYFPSIDKKHILKVGKITDKTIPYVSDDYRVYFTDEVNKHLEGWKLNEL